MVCRVAVEAEADGPFTDLDGRGGGEQGADVDGHVEEGETGVALGSVLRVVVQVSHHYLQVSFEESCPESDQEQGGDHADERHGTAAQRDGQQQIAEEHDDDAGGDHLPETELVGQDSADEREKVHQHQERAVDEAGGARVQAEVGPEEEREHGDHRVVAEALAGIGQCEGEESFGLSFEHRS